MEWIAASLTQSYSALYSFQTMLRQSIRIVSVQRRFSSVDAVRYGQAHDIIQTFRSRGHLRAYLNPIPEDINPDKIGMAFYGLHC